MKIGKCPTCRSRKVLVQHWRCGCGKDHRKIAQQRQCPTPVTELRVRNHECGLLLRPTNIQELEMKA